MTDSKVIDFDYSDLPTCFSLTGVSRKDMPKVKKSIKNQIKFNTEDRFGYIPNDFKLMVEVLHIMPDTLIVKAVLKFIGKIK